MQVHCSDQVLNILQNDKLKIRIFFSLLLKNFIIVTCINKSESTKSVLTDAKKQLNSDQTKKVQQFKQFLTQNFTSGVIK